MWQEFIVVRNISFDGISHLLGELNWRMLDLLDSCRGIDAVVESWERVLDFFLLPGQHSWIKIHAKLFANVLKYLFSFCRVHKVVTLDNEWIRLNILFDPLVILK